jgi:hypothetical protein
MPFRRITSRDIASIPQPGFNLIESIHFSPDDHLLTYLHLPNRFIFRQLYAYDLRTDREFVYTGLEDGDQTMEDQLSKEEKLRREVGVFLIL